MGILNTIKQKPESQKKVISLVISLIFTIFIVGIWFSLTYKKGDTEMANEEQNKLSSLSPIQVIKNEFSKVFSDIKKNTDTLSSTTLNNIPIEIFDDGLASTSEITATTSTTTLEEILKSFSTTSTNNNITN
jgi:hypothetical protein